MKNTPVLESDRCFLAPARNAALEGRGALYWGSKDAAKARRLEARGLVTVRATGEVVGGLTEVVVALTSDGIRVLNS